MTIKIIEHNSEEYNQMIQLRIRVLLNPIGVSPLFINKEKEKEDVLIGAFDNRTLVGCCVLTIKDNGIVQLRQMAVEINYQGKQVGKAIIEFVEKWAKESRMNKIILHARDVVIPFYNKCGYTIAGNGFLEVNIPHHKMEKSLL